MSLSVISILFFNFERNIIKIVISDLNLSSFKEK